MYIDNGSYVCILRSTSRVGSTNLKKCLTSYVLPTYVAMYVKLLCNLKFSGKLMVYVNFTINVTVMYVHRYFFTYHIAGIFRWLKFKFL